ncbi:MAG TPA: hypothetical protein VNJ11_06365 [Bryobacteraceae bacterium]|nr:hypothetical protein [Bryobacteraceae bacterium]
MRFGASVLLIALVPLQAADEFCADTTAARLFRADAAVVTEPLDFGGLAAVRRAALSVDGFTWTGTAHRLEGIEVSDPYRPGWAVVTGDTFLFRQAELKPELSAYGAAARLEGLVPESSWHGQFASSVTTAALAWNNLPPGPERGQVRQPERFHWFSWNALRAGGPLGRRAAVTFAAAGRWSSQTVGEAAPGEDLSARLVTASGRLLLETGHRQRADVFVLAERPYLSGWGLPEAAEALAARRHAPPVQLWRDLEENRSARIVQAGWQRNGLLLRYGHSRLRLDTVAAKQADRDAVPHVELTTGALEGPPPLETRALRSRHGFAVRSAWERGAHTTTAWLSLDRAQIRNRFGGPPLYGVTAAGEPAFVVVRSPTETARSGIRSLAAGIEDRVAVAPGLTIDAGLMLDASQGSVAGRRVISWTHLFRSAGVALTPPRLRSLTFRGGYERRYQVLAGRYLDFADPNSLGGLEYRWVDHNRDGRLQAGEQGELLRRFGAPYTSVSPSLRRPLVDEFAVSVEASPRPGLSARLRLFRRDEKDRIAAVNAGLPPEAFSPRLLGDPGPDFIYGTLDDAQLVVWEQDPATFGRDRFELRNPGLRTMNKGLVAELAGRTPRLDWRASFLAVKTFGPANPGNDFWENDSGTVGALLQDPNTSVNAAGRNFFDRAFSGRLTIRWEGPAGFEVASAATYLDGLAFGRRLLVRDLAQGPLVVPATVRGSPEGGHRTQFLLNWDLRVSRAFSAGRARLRFHTEVFNVLNRAARLREDDVSGPRFNERLPLALQPPRFVRLGFSVFW